MLWTGQMWSSRTTVRVGTGGAALAVIASAGTPPRRRASRQWIEAVTIVSDRMTTGGLHVAHVATAVAQEHPGELAVVLVAPAVPGAAPAVRGVAEAVPVAR